MALRTNFDRFSNFQNGFKWAMRPRAICEIFLKPFNRFEQPFSWAALGDITGGVKTQLLR